jgi:MazG family protein
MQALDHLLDIVAKLRDHETGDPWHLQQNFSSIVPYTVDEAYEVADAIGRNNMQDLCCELGDLLFQIIYLAQIASEKSGFDFTDVVNALNRKITARQKEPARHAAESGRQSFDWHKVKLREYRAGAGRESTSLLEAVPTNLPALSRAQKLQVCAAAAGFDWHNVRDVLKKIEEEFSELQTELDRVAGKSRLMHEIGDVLFACVNLSRHLEINAEGALQAASRRFEERFRYIETRLAERNLKPEEVTLDEMNQLWNEAKQAGADLRRS